MRQEDNVHFLKASFASPKHYYKVAQTMSTLVHSITYHHKPLQPKFAWWPVQVSTLQGRKWKWLTTVYRRHCNICGWLYQDLP